MYLFCYLHLLIYVNISLFHWVYFTSFFDHYIKPNICFKPLVDFLQNSCSKSVLNKFKNVPVKSPVLITVADYRSATLLKLNFFTGIFQKF